MSNDQTIRDYYTLNPNAATPVQGSVDNDTRIKFENIKKEVSKPSGNGSGGNGDAK